VPHEAPRHSAAFETRVLEVFPRVVELDPAVAPSSNGSRPPTFAATDLCNAERLVAQHGDDLRYVPGIGWHAWDGCRWRRDEDGEPMRRAKASARLIPREAEGVQDKAEHAQLLRWAITSETEPRLRAAVSLAQSEKAIIAHASQLDRDPVLLNVENGTIDLRTGELRDHNRLELITQQVGVSFEPDAECPRWDRFLAELFVGDVELIAFMQRLIGYCLTGDTREEVLAVFHGSGCNGKSTLLAILKRLLGEYARTAAFDTFMRARGDRAPRNDLARLHRARLVTAAESGEGKRLDEATVKEITGGDTIAARFLYGEHFEFTPQFKLVLVTNHRPKVDGTDDAIWRRLRLIPFEVSFEGREDRTLAATLEQELPGILNWAVQGCLDWQRNGLGAPKAVQEATSEYRQDEDHLGAFLDARCVLDGGLEIKPVELQRAYEGYCSEVGERPVARSSLGKLLKRRGISKHKRSGMYRGVRLKRLHETTKDARE
jgi:putative DNA primase/helicase